MTPLNLSAVRASMASALSGTALSGAFGEAGDIAQAHQLTVDSGNPFGGGGGGGRVDFLRAIFPPDGVPASPETITGVVDRHGLQPDLFRGSVFYSLQDVPGYTIPRLLTLSALPVDCASLAAAMSAVDEWAAWMPRFSESRSRPAGKDAKYQEAKMKAAGLTIHYQILVTDRAFGNGAQIRWYLDDTGFKKDWTALGLKINNGSCTLVPVPGRDDETYMAYEIHTEVKPLLPGTAGKITQTTIRELPDFPASLASRATNPGWDSRARPLPLRPFKMSRIG